MLSGEYSVVVGVKVSHLYYFAVKCYQCHIKNFINAHVECCWEKKLLLCLLCNNVAVRLHAVITVNRSVLK